MTWPTFVRRSFLRITAVGLAGAVSMGALGLLAERDRYGADPEAARQRLDADLRAQFTALNDRLDAAVATLPTAAPLVSQAEAGDEAALRSLFDRVAAAEAAAALDGVALTVYGGDGRALAWTGRPLTVPRSRLDGPAAVFLAPSPLGLRLVRVEPLPAPAGSDRRAGTVVAEAPLPRAAAAPASGEESFVLETSVVPVRLRPAFAGGPSAAGDAPLVVEARNGEPLATVEVPPGAMAAARERWRAHLLAAELGLLALVLLFFTGPLLDWRRVVATPRVHVPLTLGVAALVALARLLAWMALRLTGRAAPVLTSEPDPSPITWLFLASPWDFLLSALTAAALLALAASTYEQWRAGRWLRIRPARPGGWPRPAFVAAQLVAGTLVGGLLFAYARFLGAHVSRAPVDILHFSLHPLDGDRLAVVSGLLILHAAVAWLAVLLLRVALGPWRIGHTDRAGRLVALASWFGPGALVLSAAGAASRLPVVPALLALAFVVALASSIGQYRAALRHASQAARLMALFAGLMLPGLVFYPALVDVAERARRELIETRYAPEAVNQRLNLQTYLLTALSEVDGLRSLPDLVAAGAPVAAGPPPTDAAFLVWSQTVLAAQRLTSSVELYGAAGGLVSRFALKLPETVVDQQWQETSCEWELFEEVSPFFAEERRLLHAGRAICDTGPDGELLRTGSVVIHVMLDYGNLSFISAQSPYIALLRAPGETPGEPTPREAVEFAFYGWSRRPLYSSDREVWALTEPIFQQAYASRDPFWTETTRGDTTYEVYVLNDRGGLYLLGYPRASTLGHLVRIAELVTLAGVLFVGVMIGGAAFGLVVARTPASGRALLREVRASFYRKLFLAFVAASVVPVLALAFVTRAYVATLMRADVEMEATRTAASASRVVEDVGSLQARAGSSLPAVDDNLVVWLSRVIAQDVNIFDGEGLLASSERNLFASGLLPTRTPGDVYRAIVVEGRPSYVGQETVGEYRYLVAAAPVRIQNREAILTVPLTLRQQEIEAQIDELDRRVLLAALAFILLGAAIGYSMAERIADPVNRLTRATQRIARGDLDARIAASSSDELRRLVDAFNRMAADLQHQRAELERTNRLAAWAEMARQVAHDIKNPLTPIQLNAEHLRRVHADRGQPMGAVLEECVANILTQVRLLRQIASEFSSFASSPKPHPQPTDVADVVREVVEPYLTGLAGRVRIETVVPDALPRAMIDRALIGRALTNVIENALHAMPAGGTLRVEAGLDGAGAGTLRLAVADTGIGIDEEALGRLFEPYFSTKARGTGLGLTIAKRNVELNGGTIEVVSAKGMGTTVTLRVPTASSHTEPRRHGNAET